MSNRPLIRFPAISKTQIAFVHAGDIWVLGRGETRARKLTTARGEERFPRFSPNDGEQIAFSGNYGEGNDLYVVDSNGGIPDRLTFHPSQRERVVGWTRWSPDGGKEEDSILFSSDRESGLSVYPRLFRIPAAGGLPEGLPIAAAAYGSISSRGWLALQIVSPVFSTWKGYRGGQSPEIFVVDLNNPGSPAINLSRSESNDSHPMWSSDGSTLYFLSDREHDRYNLYEIKELQGLVFEEDSSWRGEPTALTEFTDRDVRHPSIGPDDEIIFEVESNVHLFSGASDWREALDIEVTSDRRQLLSRRIDFAPFIRSFDLSLSGRRLVLEARGQLFSLPASKDGVRRRLTEGNRFSARYPAWSPTENLIAYFTDRPKEPEVFENEDPSSPEKGSGGPIEKLNARTHLEHGSEDISTPADYQLAIRPGDGSGSETILTSLGPGYRYRPFFSPDGTKIAFVDHDARDSEFKKGALTQGVRQARRIRIYDFDSGDCYIVDELSWVVHSGLEDYRLSWSRCGRWLAYSRKDNADNFDALFLFDTRNRGSEESGPFKVTSGFYSDFKPVFDPKGQYLFFLTNRTFPSTAARVQGGVRFGASHIAAVPLRSDVPLLRQSANLEEIDPEEDGAQFILKARGDGEADGEVEDDRESTGATLAEDAGENEVKEDRKAAADSPAENDAENDAEGGLEVDLDGFEMRIQLLDRTAPSESLSAFHAMAGKLVMVRDRRGRAPSTLETYDWSSGSSEILAEGVDDVVLSADRGSLVAIRGAEFHFFKNVNGNFLARRKIDISRLEFRVVPREEWLQIFDDTWRFLRDFIFDPRLAGRPRWEEIFGPYQQLLERSASRADVNFVLNELAGELDVSHATARDGAIERERSSQVGLLGADYVSVPRGIEIRRILDGAAWDSEVRSPLRRAGIEPGALLTAINGRPINEDFTPYIALEGFSRKTVELLFDDGRSKCVDTLSLPQERMLRYLDWVERRRRFVSDRSNRRTGYIHIPGISGITLREFRRQLRAQMHLPSLVIDVRFNFGGQDPYFFADLLARRPFFSTGARFGQDWLSPQISHTGPKVMLINSWTGSNAELLAFVFKDQNLGTLVGSPTLGGTVGSNGAPILVDGGKLSAPNLPPRDQSGNLIGEDGADGRSRRIEPSEPHELNEIRDRPIWLTDDGVEDPYRDPQLMRALDILCGCSSRISRL